MLNPSQFASVFLNQRLLAREEDPSFSNRRQQQWSYQTGISSMQSLLHPIRQTYRSPSTPSHRERTRADDSRNRGTQRQGVSRYYSNDYHPVSENRPEWNSNNYAPTRIVKQESVNSSKDNNEHCTNRNSELVVIHSRTCSSSSSDDKDGGNDDDDGDDATELIYSSKNDYKEDALELESDEIQTEDIVSMLLAEHDDGSDNECNNEEIVDKCGLQKNLTSPIEDDDRAEMNESKNVEIVDKFGLQSNNIPLQIEDDDHARKDESNNVGIVDKFRLSLHNSDTNALQDSAPCRSDAFDVGVIHAEETKQSMLCCNDISRGNSLKLEAPDHIQNVSIGPEKQSTISSNDTSPANRLKLAASDHIQNVPIDAEKQSTISSNDISPANRLKLAASDHIQNVPIDAEKQSTISSNDISPADSLKLAASDHIQNVPIDADAAESTFCDGKEIENDGQASVSDDLHDGSTTCAGLQHLELVLPPMFSRNHCTSDKDEPERTQVEESSSSINIVSEIEKDSTTHNFALQETGSDRCDYEHLLSSTCQLFDLSAIDKIISAKLQDCREKIQMDELVTKEDSRGNDGFDRTRYNHLLRSNNSQRCFTTNVARSSAIAISEDIMKSLKKCHLAADVVGDTHSGHVFLLGQDVNSSKKKVSLDRVATHIGRIDLQSLFIEMQVPGSICDESWRLKKNPAVVIGVTVTGFHPNGKRMQALMKELMKTLLTAPFCGIHGNNLLLPSIMASSAEFPDCYVVITDVHKLCIGSDGNTSTPFRVYRLDQQGNVVH